MQYKALFIVLCLMAAPGSGGLCFRDESAAVSGGPGAGMQRSSETDAAESPKPSDTAEAYVLPPAHAAAQELFKPAPVDSATAVHTDGPGAGRMFGTPDVFSISVSCGYFVPVFKYAQRYGAAASLWLDAGLPSCSYAGFHPSFGVLYADLRTREDAEYVSSRLRLVSGTAGIRRSFRLESPAVLRNFSFFTRGLRVDAGAYCGMTRVFFTSDIERAPVVDTVGTLGVSAGFFAYLAEQVDGGVHVRAQRIFTAGTPLDSVGMSLCVMGRW